MFSLSERIIRKIKRKTLFFRVKKNRQKLNNLDFSVISNNCWGGLLYEEFGLPKLTPTVGGFFLAKDYLKFVKNLRYYLSLDIQITSLEYSSQKSTFEKLIGIGTRCLVGKLDDIEYCFLHYLEPSIAYEKWNRRICRVNYNNLIFKFSYMNNCTRQMLHDFDKLVLPGKKIMFVNKPTNEYSCAIYYPSFENDLQLKNDTFYWKRYVNIYELINS